MIKNSITHKKKVIEIPDTHALLSASSAKRWIACQPSARIAAEFPERESEAAIAGTVAHAQAEKWFLDGVVPTDPYVLQYVAAVTCYVREMQDPTMLIEHQVNFSHIAPKGFGTADCIIYNRDTLHIMDFKYGDAVRVDAKDNPQMALYALGAIRKLKIQPISIKMTIFQPRMDNVSTWAIDMPELQRIGNHIRKRADMAWNGKGELASGDHCTFCPYRNLCPAFKEYFNETYLTTF